MHLKENKMKLNRRGSAVFMKTITYLFVEQTRLYSVCWIKFEEEKKEEEKKCIVILF